MHVLRFVSIFGERIPLLFLLLAMIVNKLFKNTNKMVISTNNRRDANVGRCQSLILGEIIGDVADTKYFIGEVADRVVGCVGEDLPYMVSGKKLVAEKSFIFPKNRFSKNFSSPILGLSPILSPNLGLGPMMGIGKWNSDSRGSISDRHWEWDRIPLGTQSQVGTENGTESHDGTGKIFRKSIFRKNETFFCDQLFTTYHIW
jgi:hypothetical protein